MSTIKIKTEVEIELSIENAAKWFSGLSDDEQAGFFIAVAEEAKQWQGGNGSSYQWYRVGSHLKNCEYSTHEARELIRQIADGLEHGTH